MEPFKNVESLVNSGVQWLRLGAETLGALVIGLGILIALQQVLRALWSQGRAVDFIAIRLTLARYLALALELQLAADVLSTAIAPSWDEIGKLGAVAVIRTALNYFLSSEMKQEQKVSAAEHSVAQDAP